MDAELGERNAEPNNNKGGSAATSTRGGQGGTLGSGGVPSQGGASLGGSVNSSAGSAAGGVGNTGNGGSEVGGASTSGTAGVATVGGTSTGGTTTVAIAGSAGRGGNATGGASNGGIAGTTIRGGASTGGAMNGGTAGRGGTSTGGAINGGTAGTTARGGASTGGAVGVGGAATGGAATGGAATGGAATGGAPNTPPSGCEGANIVFGSTGITAAVRAVIGKPTGNLTWNDVRSITTLDAGSASVDSLNNLRCLTSLTTLDLSYNRITDIGELAYLPQLVDLKLNDNSDLVDITAIGSLKNLTTLTLRRCFVSSMAAFDNPKLVTLDLMQNAILTLTGFVSLPALKDLSVGWNQLADLSGLERLTTLTRLEVASQTRYAPTAEQSLVDISAVQNLKDLVEFDVHYSSVLTNLHGLENLTKVTTIDASSCGITSAAGLAGLTALTVLYLANNKVTDMTVLGTLPSLNKLDLSFNQYITDLRPLANNTAAFSSSSDSIALSGSIQTSACSSANIAGPLATLAARGVQLAEECP